MYQYISQLGNTVAGDCAPASVLMVASAYRGDLPSVQSLANRFNINLSASVSQVIQMFNYLGLPAERYDGLTIEDLQHDPRGIVLLVDYKALPRRYDPKYNYGHFVAMGRGKVYDPYSKNPLIYRPTDDELSWMLTSSKHNAAGTGVIVEKPTNALRVWANIVRGFDV